ncbi:MAG TPA: phosphoribosyltransferase family protein [Candidatus Limnocylindria bacterium]|nr:phosphoribosyltransferase family protein [Candidatus Limnocylindria bacterium]
MRLLDLILPPACAGCGQVGWVLCDRCRRAFRPPFDAGDRFVAADAGIALGDALLLALTAFRYEGPLRKSLAALKYTGASRVARPLADASVPALRRLAGISGPAILVPVPIHAERRRIRGYNQAELLARGLASAVQLPMASLLVRKRETTKQHRLDRAARLANLRDAFRPTARLAEGTAVIVVDDIVTTTATLEACASALREAGAEAVYGFAVAGEV